MNYTGIFYLSMSLTLAAFTLDASQNPFAMGPSGAKAGPDVAEFQKEMAEFQKEFDSLSPKEQESFFKAMDDAVKKIDEMSKTPEGKDLLDKLEKGTISDKELDGLINQLVTDEKPKKKKEEKPVIEEPKKIEKPKQVLTSKHEILIDALNSLIAHANAFIVKAATVPELPGKYKRWAKNKKIKSKENQIWNSFKGDIEKLVNQFSTLLERNPETKEYYHVEKLLKNENLHNNILKIEKAIARLEPRIEEMPLLEIKKMSKESKGALQDTINEFYEGLEILRLSEEIANQLKLFDEEAKKYREIADFTKQKADIAGKKSATPVSRPFAGSSSTPFQERYNYSPLSERPESVQGFSPYYADEGVFSAYDTEDDSEEAKAPTKKSSKQPLNGKAKDEKSEVQKPQLTKLGKELNQLHDKVKTKLADFSHSLKDNKLSSKLDRSFTDNSPVDLTLAVETLPEIGKLLNMQKGVLGTINQYHRKAGTKANRISQKRRLQKLYNTHKKDIEEVQAKVSALKTQYQKDKESISPAKRYAYFAEIDVKVLVPEEGEEKTVAKLKAQADELSAIKNKVIAPYSIFEIGDLIEKVKKALDSFEKDQLEEEKKSESKKP